MIIFDHHKGGYTHTQVNACFVYIYAKNYPEENIHFFCEKEHYLHIIDILAENNIVLENLIYHEIEPKEFLVREYSRFLIDFKTIKNIFYFAKENKENKILSLFTSTFQLYYLKAFCVINRNIKCLTVMHGNLEGVKIWKYKNELKKFLYYFFFGLNLPIHLPMPKNLKYIVLGESIRKNLVQTLPHISNSVVSIDHPYFYKKEKPHLPDKNFVNFGIFGVITKNRTSEFCLKLFPKLEQTGLGNFKFSIVGHIKSLNIAEHFSNYKFIELSSKEDKFLEKEEFENLAQQINYSLCFYRKDDYKLTASAAFWDAISYVKPIIALKNDYFEYYFNKFGNIGYLFDTYEEMEAKIIEIINNFPKEEYNLQIENINKLRNVLNIKNGDFLVKF